MPLLYAAASVRAQVIALTSLLDGGFLEIYSGDRPSSPAVAVSNQRRLATLRFGKPAFKLSELGGASAVLESDMDAADTGKATWFRLYRAGHELGKDEADLRVADGSIGRGATFDLSMNSVEIQRHAEVAVDRFVLTPRS